MFVSYPEGPWKIALTLPTEFSVTTEPFTKAKQAFFASQHSFKNPTFNIYLFLSDKG